MTLPLYDFAQISGEQKKLEELAKLAMDEDWSTSSKTSKFVNEKYGTLYNYIHYTFIRLNEKEAEKIKHIDNRSCFNTGLVTNKQEEIFALFETYSNKSQVRSFAGYFKASDIKFNSLRPLPEAANYFTDPSDFIYDTRLELICDYDHIVEDNEERLPSSLKNLTSYMIMQTLKGAIDSATKRIKRNYKTAVPQYYRGEIQLLIPICTENPSVADFALAVRKEGSSYVAKTCLTLEMAYNNARLLARPDREWLRP